MVSAADLEHFQRIAKGEQDAAVKAIEAAATRPPGENIVLGLELAELAGEFGSSLERLEEVSPASLWRARNSSN